MARPLRRVLAATAVSTALLTAGVPTAQAVVPGTDGCREIREPVTGIWLIIC